MHGDLEVEELLVVAVRDIEAGAVLLDQIVLKDQGFDFGVGDDDGEVGDAGNEGSGLIGMVAASEVAADATAQ